MRIYIVRHGKATDGGTACCGSGRCCGGSDFDRELTARGESQAKFLASRLGGADRRIGMIVSSRFPRALQTSHAIQPALGCAIQTDTRLEVDHDVSEALSIIHDHAGDKAVMLVGHNPQLGELISVLCSGLPPQELILKTGELVAVDVRANQLVGSGRIVERLRLDDSQADDSMIASPMAMAGARKP